MLRIIIASIALLFSSGAMAQEEKWVWAGSGANGDLVSVSFLDITTIEQKGAYKRGWSTDVFASVSKDTSKEFHANIYEEYDCNNRKMRRLQFTIYMDNDITTTTPENPAWSFVNPSTKGGEVYSVICSNGPYETLPSAFDPVEGIEFVRKALRAGVNQ